MLTHNVIYLYLVGAGVVVFVLGALAWTALMCFILCREDEREGGDEEKGVRRGKYGERSAVRGKEDGDVEKVEAGKMEMKVDGFQGDIERVLVRKESEV